MLPALSDTRATWAVYAILLSLAALLFFAQLPELPLDTHDGDYFLDSADALADPAAFFAADKRMPGRPALELVFFCCNTWLGAMTRPATTSLAVCSTCSPP